MNDALTAMRTTLTIGRLFDIRVGVHVSWIAVFAFMVFSIAGTIGGVSRSTAVEFGVVCALLLFASVIAHEFAHALVARAYGVRTHAITLFLFGGVATLECEPPTPRAETAIAFAGPAMSALIGLTAFGLLALIERFGAGELAAPAGNVAAYVALANGVLAVFNLLPAFPMDGGRVLRAAIWRVRKSRAAATGAASLVGLFFAAGFVAAGIAAVVLRHAWQELWYAAVGAFLLRAGWVQFTDSRFIERLERVRVRDVMEAADTLDGEAEVLEGFSLTSTASALDAVSAFRSSSRASIPVVDAGRLAGWLRRDRTLAIVDRAA